MIIIVGRVWMGLGSNTANYYSSSNVRRKVQELGMLAFWAEIISGVWNTPPIHNSPYSSWWNHTIDAWPLLNCCTHCLYHDPHTMNGSSKMVCSIHMKTQSQHTRTNTSVTSETHLGTGRRHGQPVHNLVKYLQEQREEEKSWTAASQHVHFKELLQKILSGHFRPVPIRKKY